MSTRNVVVVGSTGLVGREIVRLLGAEPTVARITTLVRRPQSLGDPKVEEALVDFERLSEASVVPPCDQFFSALGTTIKVAGSQEAFRRVDFDYPLQLAKQARAAGATHYLLVSALGATSSSRVFYSRVKGELEDAVAALGFRSLTIARPSLLVGNRTEYRRGEEIGRYFAFLTPRTWKPVDVRQVAAALVHAAREDAPGTRILENRQLLDFPIA